MLGQPFATPLQFLGLTQDVWNIYFKKYIIQQNRYFHRTECVCRAHLQEPRPFYSWFQVVVFWMRNWLPLLLISVTGESQELLLLTGKKILITRWQVKPCLWKGKHLLSAAFHAFAEFLQEAWMWLSFFPWGEGMLLFKHCGTIAHLHILCSFRQWTGKCHITDTGMFFLSL